MIPCVRSSDGSRASLGKLAIKYLPAVRVSAQCQQAGCGASGARVNGKMPSEARRIIGSSTRELRRNGECGLVPDGRMAVTGTMLGRRDVWRCSQRRESV